MPTIVLLSGGMDSTVCLYWAVENCPSPIHALSFDYGQRAVRELEGAKKVWERLLTSPLRKVLRMGEHTIAKLDRVFVSSSSILGDSDVQTYDSPEAAIKGTKTDQSFIPLRNAVLLSLAAHHLLARHPDGGTVVTGIRGRVDPINPGFPDCTHKFASAMGYALTVGHKYPVNVIDPLNIYAPTRSKTIQLARKLGPECFEALALTTSCYQGYSPPCGKCLPCTRRAQAFADVGVADPALRG
jgi:7-cyano-7-deazaguanine synthase